jgi:hypothetical protein
VEEKRREKKMIWAAEEKRKERVFLEERLEFGAVAGAGAGAGLFLLHLKKHSWLSSPWQRKRGRN